MAFANMSWDELNQLVGFKRSEPFEQYYAPMKITEAQKRKRIELAEQLEDVMIGLLSFMFYAQQQGTIPYTDAYERAYEEYILILNNILNPDEYLLNHAETVLTDIISVTYRHPDEEYYYSADRARLISENEANSIYNYDEFQDAIDNGYHYKTWETIMDGKERESHAEVNGVTIPINDVFHLQGGDCYYPRSDELGMSDEEIVNCRCSLSYS